MNKLGTCTICKIDSSENYCANCGQKLNVKKATILSLIKEFASNAIDVERSAFATLFKILKSPSLVVDNYFEGYRKYYPSPARMFFYALTSRFFI